MNQFRINKYISLKLENSKTNIYINGTLFNQCKILLLLTSDKDYQRIKNINSIDEISEVLDISLDLNRNYYETEIQDILDTIDPETEFWGHCSNLQAWVENKYDTRLLHSNLAFPLLKKLTEVGDSIAVKRFKEEIAKRYSSGSESVQTYLEEEGYLDYLNQDEKKILIKDDFDLDVVDELENILGISLEISVVEDIFKNIILRNGKLIRLNLDHLALRNFPECIQRLQNIEILYLVGNKIEELPDWIGELKTLKKLILFSNRIRKIPDSIRKLKYLKFLDLSNNQIEILPKNIGELKSLIELRLYNNKIKQLPNTIGLLKKIEIIDLHNNHIYELPSTLENLYKLQYLDVTNNPVNHFKINFSRLKSLKKISMQGTNIKLTNEQLSILKEKNVDFWLQSPYS
jgi:Leucine-rich repeat (LRR) protein